MTIRRFLVVCVGLSALGTSLFSQTPDVIVVFKGPGFQQTGPTTTQPFEPGYGAIVTFPAAVPLTTTVQLSGQNVVVSLTRTLPDTFYVETYFTTEAALNAALPDGAYNVVVNGTPSTTTPITIGGGAALRPTLFRNYGALQNWNGSALTLEWDPIENASRQDFISVTVERADGTTVYESPELGELGSLDGTATSITIPALNVTPGESLTIMLTYVQFGVSLGNNGRTVIASGRGFFLRAPLIRAMPARPLITVQPRAQTVVAGSTVVFWVGANDAATYQWRRNGVPIANATNSSYILSNAQTSSEGFFTVDVGNATGSTTSDSVALTIASKTAVPARISNLAIRSQAGAGAQTLIVGFAIGGASGTQPLLLRAVGPALAAFGVTGTLADPRLEVYAGANKVNENDNWGGDAQVSTIGAQVGAFPLGAATTRDAALYHPSLAAGSYSIQVTGAGGGTGVALAEIYDASTSSASGVRLTNVSARTQVGTGGDVLIAGFAISGQTSKTVLIRAIGPTLTSFGVAGALSNPKLELFSGATAVAANDDWGGNAQITNLFMSAGAFPISANSRDAAVVVTLAPGSYTAQVSGVNNSTGIALVEVYEVP